MARGTEKIEARLTYTVIEAGKLMGVGKGLAYEAARRGELPTVKIGGRILVPRAALAAMLSRTCSKAA